MSAPDFIVHDAKDTVGVIVKEGIAANTTLTGWVMEDDSRCELKCIDAIPLGHKIALADIADGDTILKYGADIGRSEEHTSELQSLMRISYAVFCLKKKK